MSTPTGVTSIDLQGQESHDSNSNFKTILRKLNMVNELDENEWITFSLIFKGNFRNEELTLEELRKVINGIGEAYCPNNFDTPFNPNETDEKVKTPTIYLHLPSPEEIEDSAFISFIIRTFCDKGKGVQKSRQMIDSNSYELSITVKRKDLNNNVIKLSTENLLNLFHLLLCSFKSNIILDIKQRVNHVERTDQSYYQCEEEIDNIYKTYYLNAHENRRSKVPNNSLIASSKSARECYEQFLNEIEGVDSILGILLGKEKNNPKEFKFLFETIGDSLLSFLDTLLKSGLIEPMYGLSEDVVVSEDNKNKLFLCLLFDSFDSYDSTVEHENYEYYKITDGNLERKTIEEVKKNQQHMDQCVNIIKTVATGSDTKSDFLELCLNFLKEYEESSESEDEFIENYLEKLDHKNLMDRVDPTSLNEKSQFSHLFPTIFDLINSLLEGQNQQKLKKDGHGITTNKDRLYNQDIGDKYANMLLNLLRGDNISPNDKIDEIKSLGRDCVEINFKVILAMQIAILAINKLIQDGLAHNLKCAVKISIYILKLKNDFETYWLLTDKRDEHYPVHIRGLLLLAESKVNLVNESLGNPDKNFSEKVVDFLDCVKPYIFDVRTSVVPLKEQLETLIAQLKHFSGANGLDINNADPGSGKTMITIALMIHLCRKGYHIVFNPGPNMSILQDIIVNFGKKTSYVITYGPAKNGNFPIVVFGAKHCGIITGKVDTSFSSKSGTTTRGREQNKKERAYKEAEGCKVICQGKGTSPFNNDQICSQYEAAIGGIEAKSTSPCPIDLKNGLIIIVTSNLEDVMKVSQERLDSGFKNNNPNEFKYGFNCLITDDNSSSVCKDYPNGVRKIRIPSLQKLLELFAFKDDNILTQFSSAKPKASGYYNFYIFRKGAYTKNKRGEIRGTTTSGDELKYFSFKLISYVDENGEDTDEENHTFIVVDYLYTNNTESVKNIRTLKFNVRGKFPGQFIIVYDSNLDILAIGKNGRKCYFEIVEDSITIFFQYNISQSQCGASILSPTENPNTIQPITETKVILGPDEHPLHLGENSDLGLPSDEGAISSDNKMGLKTILPFIDFKHFKAFPEIWKMVVENLLPSFMKGQLYFFRLRQIIRNFLSQVDKNITYVGFEEERRIIQNITYNINGLQKIKVVDCMWETVIHDSEFKKFVHNLILVITEGKQFKSDTIVFETITISTEKLKTVDFFDYSAKKKRGSNMNQESLSDFFGRIVLQSLKDKIRNVTQITLNDNEIRLYLILWLLHSTLKGMSFYTFLNKLGYDNQHPEMFFTNFLKSIEDLLNESRYDNVFNKYIDDLKECLFKAIQLNTTNGIYVHIDDLKGFQNNENAQVIDLQSVRPEDIHQGTGRICRPNNNNPGVGFVTNLDNYPVITKSALRHDKIDLPNNMNKCLDDITRGFKISEDDQIAWATTSINSCFGKTSGWNTLNSVIDELRNLHPEVDSIKKGCGMTAYTLFTYISWFRSCTGNLIVSILVNYYTSLLDTSKIDFKERNAYTDEYNPLIGKDKCYLKMMLKKCNPESDLLDILTSDLPYELLMRLLSDSDLSLPAIFGKPRDDPKKNDLAYKSIKGGNDIKILRGICGNLKLSTDQNNFKFDFFKTLTQEIHAEAIRLTEIVDNKWTGNKSIPLIIHNDGVYRMVMGVVHNGYYVDFRQLIDQGRVHWQIEEQNFVLVGTHVEIKPHIQIEETIVFSLPVFSINEELKELLFNENGKFRSISDLVINNKYDSLLDKLFVGVLKKVSSQSAVSQNARQNKFNQKSHKLPKSPKETFLSSYHYLTQEGDVKTYKHPNDWVRSGRGDYSLEAFFNRIAIRTDNKIAKYSLVQLRKQIPDNHLINQDILYIFKTVFKNIIDVLKPDKSFFDGVQFIFNYCFAMMFLGQEGTITCEHNIFLVENDDLKELLLLLRTFVPFNFHDEFESRNKTYSTFLVIVSMLPNICQGSTYNIVDLLVKYKSYISEVFTNYDIKVINAETYIRLKSLLQKENLIADIYKYIRFIDSYMFGDSLDCHPDLKVLSMGNNLTYKFPHDLNEVQLYQTTTSYLLNNNKEDIVKQLQKYFDKSSIIALSKYELLSIYCNILQLCKISSVYDISEYLNRLSEVFKLESKGLDVLFNLKMIILYKSLFLEYNIGNQEFETKMTNYIISIEANYSKYKIISEVVECAKMFMNGSNTISLHNVLKCGFCQDRELLNCLGINENSRPVITNPLQKPSWYVVVLELKNGNQYNSNLCKDSSDTITFKDLVDCWINDEQKFFNFLDFLIMNNNYLSSFVAANQTLTSIICSNNRVRYHKGESPQYDITMLSNMLQVIINLLMNRINENIEYVADPEDQTLEININGNKIKLQFLMFKNKQKFAQLLSNTYEGNNIRTFTLVGDKKVQKVKILAEFFNGNRYFDERYVESLNSLTTEGYVIVGRVNNELQTDVVSKDDVDIKSNDIKVGDKIIFKEDCWTYTKNECFKIVTSIDEGECQKMMPFPIDFKKWVIIPDQIDETAIDHDFCPGFSDIIELNGCTKITKKMIYDFLFQILITLNEDFQALLPEGFQIKGQSRYDLAKSNELQALKTFKREVEKIFTPCAHKLEPVSRCQSPRAVKEGDDIVPKVLTEETMEDYKPLPNGLLVHKHHYPYELLKQIQKVASNLPLDSLYKFVTYLGDDMPNDIPGSVEFNDVITEECFRKSIHSYHLRIEITKWRIYLITYLIDLNVDRITAQLIEAIKTDNNLVLFWNFKFKLNKIIEYLSNKFETIKAQRQFISMRESLIGKYDIIIKLLKEKRRNYEEIYDFVEFD